MSDSGLVGAILVKARKAAGLNCPIPYECKLENVVIPDEKKIEGAIKKVLGR